MDIKQTIYVISIILSVFLATLLIFSIINQEITLFMVVGALAVTYIFIHYWEKRYLQQKRQKSEIKSTKTR